MIYQYQQSIMVGTEEYLQVKQSGREPLEVDSATISVAQGSHSTNITSTHTAPALPVNKKHELTK
jgi:hypothetical protein